MKKLRVMILATVMFMVMGSMSNAAEFSCKVGVTSSSNKVKSGDTVTINFIINNLELSDGSLGVTILDGYLEYDKTIFEEVKQANINCGANRSVTYLDSSNRVFVEFENKDGMITTSGTKMFSVTMKVKDNAQFEKTQVKLNNIIVTDNNQEVKISSVGVLLQSEKVASPKENTIENIGTTTDRSNSRIDTTSSSTVNDDVKTDSSVKKSAVSVKEENTDMSKNVVDMINLEWLFNSDGSVKVGTIIATSVEFINGVAEVIISICM